MAPSARLAGPAAAGGQVSRVLELAVRLQCDAERAKVIADKVAACRSLDAASVTQRRAQRKRDVAPGAARYLVQ